MSFEFICPFCLNRTQVAEEYLGKRGPCVECGRVVVMPTRDEAGRLVAAVQTGQERLDRKVNDKKVAEGKVGEKALARDERAKDPTDWYVRRAILLGLFCMVVAASSTFIFIGLPAIRKRVLAQARGSDFVRMVAIVKALNAYSDKYGTYPTPVVQDAAGKPLYSWRVLILPFLGYQELYDKFQLDQAWDSPANQTLISKMPSEFCSPNSSDAAGFHQPNFVLVVGPGTLFPATGPLGRKGVLDSPTILLVETLNGPIVWTEPGDIDIQGSGPQFGFTPMQSIGGLHSEAALAVDTKEREMVISNGTSPGVLKSLLTPNGAEPIVDKDWDWLDRP